MKIHVIQQGDTLIELAQKYNVPVERLLEANPTLGETDGITLSVGGKVRIPTGKISLQKNTVTDANKAVTPQETEVIGEQPATEEKRIATRPDLEREVEVNPETETAPYASEEMEEGSYADAASAPHFHKEDVVAPDFSEYPEPPYPVPVQYHNYSSPAVNYYDPSYAWSYYSSYGYHPYPVYSHCPPAHLSGYYAYPSRYAPSYQTQTYPYPSSYPGGYEPGRSMADISSSYPGYYPPSCGYTRFPEESPW